MAGEASDWRGRDMAEIAAKRALSMIKRRQHVDCGQSLPSSSVTRLSCSDCHRTRRAWSVEVLLSRAKRSVCWAPCNSNFQEGLLICSRNYVVPCSSILAWTV
eukprot:2037676-Amphidinium_carterae.1